MYMLVDDLEKVRQFVESEDLREAMEQSGVVDKPDLYFPSLVARPSAELTCDTDKRDIAFLFRLSSAR